jgi:predicted DNA-binding WGR domain protein
VPVVGDIWQERPLRSGRISDYLYVAKLQLRSHWANQQRFYAITVTPTLFGSWAMVREWGRIGQPGMVWEAWFETEGEAWAAGEQWRQRKEKRGYHVVGG